LNPSNEGEPVSVVKDEGRDVERARKSGI